MTMVWNDAPFEKGALLLLLALADWADDNGDGWYFISTLAAKARQSERTTQLLLAKFETLGIVVCKRGQGRGKETRFHLNIAALGVPKGEKISPKRVKKIHPKPGKGVKFDAQKGEICATPPRPPYKDETKENSPSQPASSARAGDAGDGYVLNFFSKWSRRPQDFPDESWREAMRWHPEWQGVDHAELAWEFVTKAKSQTCRTYVKFLETAKRTAEARGENYATNTRPTKPGSGSDGQPVSSKIQFVTGKTIGNL
jgi:hypothetical protein